MFWISYFIFEVIRWGSRYEDYFYSFQSNLVTVSFTMILVYINIYYLIPEFVLKKKYKTYVFLFFIILCVWYLVRTACIYFWINPDVWPESTEEETGLSFNHVVEVFTIGIGHTALFTAIKLTADWIHERKRVERLQEMQLRTELDFLKSQMQPHFFFNTLNNLYALALAKSDDTPSVILKLSDIMEYILYDVRATHVRLFDAITYINNYIDLERLRFGEDIESEIDISGEIDEISIPPLLFLPFIENCFKHGIKKNNNVKIKIEFINEHNEYLIFKVENTFSKGSDERIKHGIGNKNVRRRLELLYNSKFELSTEVIENTYKVFLKIPI